MTNHTFLKTKFRNIIFAGIFATSFVSFFIGTKAYAAPIDWWTLNGNVNDSIGSFNGTFSGGYAPGNGQTNSASFDSSHQVSFSGTPLNGTGDWSVSVDFQASSTGSPANFLFGWGSNTSPNYSGYAFGLGNGAGANGNILTGLVPGVAWNNLSSCDGTALNDNTWHNLQIEYNAASTSINLNLDNTIWHYGCATITGGIVAAPKFSIGGIDGYGFWHGNIQNVKVYNYLLSAPPVSGPQITLVSPTSGTITYNDFANWNFLATSTPGHTLEYDIQYNTADNLSSSGNSPSDNSYCGLFPGALDAATTTITTTSTKITLPKSTGITPYVQNIYTNSVLGSGYTTTIYLKVCAADYTTGLQSIATTTFKMEYGGSPLNTGGTTSTLTLIYPTSSITLYPPLLNYAFLANGLVSSTLYTLHTTDQVIGITPLRGSTKSYLGSQILQQGLSADNDFYSYDFGNATSVPITINAILSNGQTPLASTSLTFLMQPLRQVLASGTIINANGTTTLINPFPEQINGSLTGSASTTQTLSNCNFPTCTTNGNPLSNNLFPSLTCPSPTGPTDIGGGIYWAGCALFQLALFPGPSAEVSLEQAVVNMEGVPPFVYFFSVNNAVANAAGAAPAAQGPLQIQVVDKMNGGTSTLTILPADPSTNPFLGAKYQGAPTNVVNLWFNLVLEGCILLLMIMFYKLVL